MVRTKKPPKCCHPNCFKCPYVECRWNDMTTDDYTETNRRDYELYEDSTGRKYHKGSDEEYRKNWVSAYNRSERGKSAQKRYRDSEKGKENERRKRKRKIASGKNAESCRRYYERHKEEILERKRKARRKEADLIGNRKEAV